MIPLETIIPNKHRIRVVLDSFNEWLRGLDFTMPDRMYDRKRNDGGMYLVSSEKIVSELMGMVDKQKYPGFLDVGCGKGFILWKAYQSGFKKIGGVEYDEKLTEICNKNMKRLKLTDYMTVTCTDAREFENYGDYDVCHEGTIMAMLCYVLHTDIPRNIIHVANCAVCAFKFGNGVWELGEWNETGSVKL